MLSTQLVIISLLLFGIFLLTIIVTFLKPYGCQVVESFSLFGNNKKKNKNDKKNDKITFIITQQINKPSEMDLFKIYPKNKNRDVKPIFKSKGQWNLMERECKICCMDDDQEIDISCDDNIYKFNDTKNKIKAEIEYISNNIKGENCADININDFEDTLTVCRNDKNILFKSENDIISQIQFQETFKNKKGKSIDIYKLEINDLDREDEYMVYLITFLIFKQVDKEIHMNMD